MVWHILPNWRVGPPALHPHPPVLSETAFQLHPWSFHKATQPQTCQLPTGGPSCHHDDKQQWSTQRQWQQQATRKQSNKRDRYWCERECGTSGSIRGAKMAENKWLKQKAWLPMQAAPTEHKWWHSIGNIDIHTHLPLSLSQAVHGVAVVHSGQQWMVLHREYEHMAKVLARPWQGQTEGPLTFQWGLGDPLQPMCTKCHGKQWFACNTSALCVLVYHGYSQPYPRWVNFSTGNIPKILWYTLARVFRTPYRAF
jgi:hypothetical protein